MSMSSTGWSGCLRLAAISVVLVGPAFAQADTLDRPADGRFSSTGTAGDDIVASVGRHEIRKQEVERRWQEQDSPGFARVRQQVREGETRALEALIGDYLLQQDAERQHVTVEDLVSRLRESVEDPTEAEVREMFEKSSASGQGATLQLATPLISKYLKQQKVAEARRQYVEALKRSTPPDIRLPLESWRQTIAIEPGEPRTGADAAPVQIVEFSDFECPYCRRTAPVLKQVLAKYQGQVKLVWKDFPLPMHRFARPAAEAAQCANEQGRFWQYHDALFLHQDALAPTDLKAYAGEIGLNVAAFSACLDAGRYQRRVAAGIQEGTRLGISATPTVFINGRMMTGTVPAEAYEEVIREELASLGTRR